MLDFTTNRIDIENELIDEIKLFFPYLEDCKYKIVHECVEVATESKIEWTNTVSVDDKAFEFNSSVDLPSTVLEIKRLSKRAAKASIFGAIKEVSGIEVPWGSLTGIRPSKLVYDMLGEGVTLNECRKEMQKRFSVSEKKANLICDIVQNQEGFYQKNERLFNLYVHIPFCTTKCNYCSFITEPLHRCKRLIPDYVKTLRREIEDAVSQINARGKLFSVYVGGGTPTALEANEIISLFEGFPFSEVEFTVEAGRPDTITKEKMDALKSLGVNRVCVNPQTLNDQTLNRIGRAHTSADFFEKYALVKQYGFRINVDLIAGLNGETLNDFKYTLDKINDIRPDNITVHTLSRKNGSALKNEGRYENDEVSAMVSYAYDELTRAGYLPYYLYRQKQMLGNQENVGYCLPGTQCANNITTMEDCLSVIACGAGAITKIVLPSENRIERFADVRDVRLYLQTFEEKLKDKQKFCEKQFTNIF
ncbi:MAG: coproporphyrinogen dehydrogenase HemZ [Clostridia bacterium]|nr:coproporphyrinogen dehydrogenase HemZ [Clostridia bacterium]